MKESKAVHVTKSDIKDEFKRTYLLYLNTVVTDREFALDPVRYDLETQEVGCQYDSKQDNVICTCRNLATTREKREIRYTELPKQINTNQGSRSFTEIGIGRIRTVLRKKVKKIYLPEIDNRGVGSSDLSSYFIRSTGEYRDSGYYENKKTSSKCVGGILEYNKDCVMNEKLSPMVQTASHATSPNKSMSNRNTPAQVEKGVKKYYESNFDEKGEIVDSVLMDLEESKEIKIELDTSTFSASKDRDSEKIYSSDSLIHRFQNLKNESHEKTEGISKDYTDPMENEIEREYRRIFESKSNITKSRIDKPIPNLQSTSTLRRRFEALRRGLAKKEDLTKNALIVTKVSSQSNIPSHKDISLNSDPLSLEARSYSSTKNYSTFSHSYSGDQSVYNPKTSYIKSVIGRKEQKRSALWPLKADENDSESQGLKCMFKLWGKKINFDEYYCPTPKSSYNNSNKSEKKVVVHNLIKTEAEVKKEGRKFFFFKKKIKEHKEKIYKSKKGVTAGRCEVRDGMKIKIGAAAGIREPEKMIKRSGIKSIEYEDMVKNPWLEKFLTRTIESQNSVQIRWNNKAYGTSSSTVFELMDNVFKETGVTFRSKSHVIYRPSYKSYVKHPVNFAHQNIEAWMIPKTLTDRPRILPATIKCKSNEERKDNIEVTISDQKWFIDKSKAFSHKIEVVLHSKNFVNLNKEESSEYLRIDIPRGFFVDSSSDDNNKNPPNQSSDEEVYKIVEYETGSDLKKDNLINSSEIGDHKENNIKITVSVKESKNCDSRALKTITNNPPLQRDVVIQGSDVFIPKRCDVIGVGIITQRDLKEMRKPILKIQDDSSDEESEHNMLKPIPKKCEFAESYLQDYYRRWTPLGIDLYSWCVSDSHMRCCSEHSGASFNNQGDGTKSCPNINNDFQTSTIFSSCGASSCSQCYTYEEVEPCDKCCWFKFRKKCKSPRTDPNSVKRIYPKDSIEVFKRRKIYAASNKSQWMNCPVSSAESKDTPPRSCCKPVETKPNGRSCQKHVSLPDCENMNDFIAKQLASMPGGLLAFKGGVSCHICRKKGFCSQHAKTDREPTSTIPDTSCRQSCEKMEKLPLAETKQPDEAPVTYSGSSSPCAELPTCPSSTPPCEEPPSCSPSYPPCEKRPSCPPSPLRCDKPEECILLSKRPPSCPPSPLLPQKPHSCSPSPSSCEKPLLCPPSSSPDEEYPTRTSSPPSCEEHSLYPLSTAPCEVSPSLPSSPPHCEELSSVSSTPSPGEKAPSCPPSPPNCKKPPACILLCKQPTSCPPSPSSGLSSPLPFKKPSSSPLSPSPCKTPPSCPSSIPPCETTPLCPASPALCDESPMSSPPPPPCEEPPTCPPSLPPCEQSPTCILLYKKRSCCSPSPPSNKEAPTLCTSSPPTSKEMPSSHSSPSPSQKSTSDLPSRQPHRRPVPHENMSPPSPPAPLASKPCNTYPCNSLPPQYPLSSVPCKKAPHSHPSFPSCQETFPCEQPPLPPCRKKPLSSPSSPVPPTSQSQSPPPNLSAQTPKKCQKKPPCSRPCCKCTSPPSPPPPPTPPPNISAQPGPKGRKKTPPSCPCSLSAPPPRPPSCPPPKQSAQPVPTCMKKTLLDCPCPLPTPPRPPSPMPKKSTSEPPSTAPGKKKSSSPPSKKPVKCPAICSPTGSPSPPSSRKQSSPRDSSPPPPSQRPASRPSSPPPPSRKPTSPSPASPPPPSRKPASPCQPCPPPPSKKPTPPCQSSPPPPKKTTSPCSSCRPPTSQKPTCPCPGSSPSPPQKPNSPSQSSPSPPTKKKTPCPACSPPPSKQTSTSPSSSPPLKKPPLSRPACTCSTPPPKCPSFSPPSCPYSTMPSPCFCNIHSPPYIPPPQYFFSSNPNSLLPPSRPVSPTSYCSAYPGKPPPSISALSNHTSNSEKNPIMICPGSPCCKPAPCDPAFCTGGGCVPSPSEIPPCNMPACMQSPIQKFSTTSVSYGLGTPNAPYFYSPIHPCPQEENAKPLCDASPCCKYKNPPHFECQSQKEDNSFSEPPCQDCRMSNKGFSWPIKNQLSNKSSVKSVNPKVENIQYGECAKNCPMLPQPSCGDLEKCKKSCPNKFGSPLCLNIPEMQCPPPRPPPTSPETPPPSEKIKCRSKTKTSGVHLRMKPANSKPKMCCKQCLAWKGKLQAEDGIINLNSEEKITIRLKKEETPSTQEDRKDLSVRREDKDEPILFERRDYNLQHANCSTHNPSIFGDLHKASEVRRMTTSNSVQAIGSDQDHKHIAEGRSDASIANLIEIQFKLKVTQGEKTTEINIANESDNENEIEQEIEKVDQIPKIPQEDFFVKAEGEHPADQSNHKNDISIRIVIKNFKPKLDKNKSIKGDDYSKEFSKQISAKLNTVSTAYSDIIHDDNTFSVHRATVDLTTSVEKAKTTNSKRSEELIETHHGNGILMGSDPSIYRCTTTEMSDNKLGDINKTSTPIEKYSSNKETQEYQEIDTDQHTDHRYDTEETDRYKSADHQSDTEDTDSEKLPESRYNDEDSDTDKPIEPKFDTFMLTDTDKQDAMPKRNICEEVSKSIEIIAEQHTKNKKTDMLKNMLEKAHEAKGKTCMKKLRDMLKVILTSDSNDHNETNLQNNNLAKDVTYASLKPNYFRDTDSMNNYYRIESNATLSDGEINKHVMYPTGEENSECDNSSPSGVVSSENELPTPVQMAGAGGCMCNIFAERLKLSSRIGDIGGCTCGTKSINKRNEETTCDLKKDSNYYQNEYNMANYVDVETQNSIFLTSKINSTNLSRHESRRSSAIGSVKSVKTDSEAINIGQKTFPSLRKTYSPRINYVRECEMRNLNRNTTLSMSDEEKVVLLSNNSTRVTGESQSKSRKKKYSYPVTVSHASHILQSYETKKAVLEIYTERTVSDEGEHLVAKLPKFVYDRENEIQTNYEAMATNNYKAVCKRNIVMMAINR